MAQLERDLLLEDMLDELFRRYGRELAEYVLSLCKRVVQVAVHILGFSKLPKLKHSIVAALGSVLRQIIALAYYVVMAISYHTIPAVPCRKLPLALSFNRLSGSTSQT